MKGKGGFSIMDSRSSTRKKKKSSTLSYIIASIIFISVMAVGAVIFVFYPFPSTERIAYFNSEYPIIFNEKVFEGEAKLIDGTLYIAYDFFKRELDPTVFYDEKSNSMILTTKDKVVQIHETELHGFVNNEPFQFEIPVLLSSDGVHVVHLDPLLNIYPLQLSFNDEYGVLFIYEEGQIIETGTIADNLSVHEARLRMEPTVTAPYTDHVTAGEPVTIEGDQEDHLFVRKENGIAGYIEKSSVTLNSTPEMVKSSFVTEEVVRREIKEPINLTWEAVYSVNPKTNELPQMPGVNVVSPTWFKLKNELGDISNLGSYDYINWAKNRNLQVWGLFSNGFDPDLTHEALKDFETRQNMIRQLLQYSEMYGLDGINVDFENVYLKDGPLVTQFMRELTPYLHKVGLIVSMDITFISNSEMWSMFYEREALTEIVDYMVVMAYDEHWATSPQSGSVASLPWVERNSKRLLEIIPNEKLILGIPLYTRVWKEQETEGGNIEVSSKSLSMNQVNQWIQEKGVETAYDVASGQNYVEYYDEVEKATYKIWIEDEESIKKRVDLVKKYNLPGVASWARSFANDSAWETLNQELNTIVK